MPSTDVLERYEQPTPELRLDRAVADYLYVSRAAKTLYGQYRDYDLAEEKVWQALVEALKEHPEYNIKPEPTIGQAEGLPKK